MTVEQFLKETFVEKHGMVMRNPIECADGFSVSVQASSFHYCDPRTNTDAYSSVELGFPSQPDELILPYAEDAENPTQTVYGHVPVYVVQNLIEKHGGFKP